MPQFIRIIDERYKKLIVKSIKNSLINCRDTKCLAHTGRKDVHIVNNVAFRIIVHMENRKKTVNNVVALPFARMVYRNIHVKHVYHTNFVNMESDMQDVRNVVDKIFVYMEG